MSSLLESDLCLTRCPNCGHERNRAMIKGEMTRLTMCTKCHKVGELEKIGFKSSTEKD